MFRPPALKRKKKVRCRSLPRTASAAHPKRTAPWQGPAKDAVAEDVRALVQLADTNRSRKLSATWGRIERPLAAYRTVFKGVEK